MSRLRSTSTWMTFCFWVFERTFRILEKIQGPADQHRSRADTISLPTSHFPPPQPGEGDRECQVSSQSPRLLRHPRILSCRRSGREQKGRTVAIGPAGRVQGTVSTSPYSYIAASPASGGSFLFSYALPSQPRFADCSIRRTHASNPTGRMINPSSAPESRLILQ